MVSVVNMSTVLTYRESFSCAIMVHGYYFLLSDGNIGWLARGSALEVFSNKDGQRLAAWCFGVVLRDERTVITAVADYTYDNGTKLLVATSTPSSKTALLSVFDVKTSKILKAIEIPCQVKSLTSHVLFSGI